MAYSGDCAWGIEEINEKQSGDLDSAPGLFFFSLKWFSSYIFYLNYVNPMPALMRNLSKEE